MNKRLTLAVLALLCTLVPALGQTTLTDEKDDVTTNLNPGSYQVHIAVRNLESVKIGSASQFVDVPDLKGNRPALSGIVLRDSREGLTQPTVMTTPPGRRFTVNPISISRFLFTTRRPG